jgi:rhodanese-related sulfurtransferase
MDKQKKEKIAIAIGISLILIVAVITIIRSITPEEKEVESSAQSAEQNTKDALKVISSKELQQEIFSRKGTSIIDIRPAEDFSNEHILDSISLPNGDISSLTDIDKNSKLVIVTQSADDQSAQIATEYLSGNGYANVYILKGGINAWVASGEKTIYLGDPTKISDQAKLAYISTDELKKTLSDEKQFILDVREKNAFAEGHIKNSINIPFDDLESRRREIPSTKKIIVCGQNEIQEFQAAVKISDMLVASPFVLKGSVEKWKQQGFEIVK